MRNSISYDTMQVCLNGHVITDDADSQPETKRNFCERCGATTATQCPKCNAKIHGSRRMQNGWATSVKTAPKNCHGCGEPYPWSDKLDFLINGKSSFSAQSANVFIVHGHDNEMKQAVARVLEKLELTPIILHEQANQGNTLIEKFESNADVGFAVVLISPDDMAFPKAKSCKDAIPRSRQNVILELGYFFGRLGRARVFALKRTGPLELPSDMAGIVYNDFDINGAWQLLLARELKTVGYTIDMNRLA